MRRIHGYVLVKESNQGVPSLVVCAFDTETELQELISERPRAGIPPLVMERLGKRIGSVLTDKDGAFHLTRDDLHFEGVESRPDLVLVVLAPEDIVDPKRPYVLPPEQRLLYISTVPRTDAGAEEAYMIRLQQAQLDAFHIPLNSVVTGAQQRLAATTALLQDLEANARSRADLKTSLHPRLKEQHKKNVEFREEAKKRVQLSALPLSVRKHPHLLKDPADLLKLQQTVVTAGLKRLKAYYEPQLHLTLRATELRSIGINVNKKGKARGQIKTLKLADKMREMLGGVSLVRKDDLAPSSVSAEALYARYSRIGNGSADDATRGGKRKKSSAKRRSGTTSKTPLRRTGRG